MQLEEFYDYKNQLMDDLLTNAEIIRLLDDNYKDSDQPERFVYIVTSDGALTPVDSGSGSIEEVKIIDGGTAQGTE